MKAETHYTLSITDTIFKYKFLKTLKCISAHLIICLLSLCNTMEIQYIFLQSDFQGNTINACELPLFVPLIYHIKWTTWFLINSTALKFLNCAFLLIKLMHFLAQVLWRYKGKKPATLGANTRLYDWIPQNDLLGKIEGETLYSWMMNKLSNWEQLSSINI